MTWHIKPVDYKQGIKLTVDLHKAYTAYAMARGGKVPVGMTVFGGDDPNAPGDSNWYFPPEAADLAAMFGGLPCEKPAPTPGSGFSLIVGDQRDWEVHFPGYLAARHQNRHPFD